MARLRRLLYGFLCGILMSLPACAAFGASEITDSQLAAGYERAAWMMACEAKQFDCTKIRGVVVAYTDMPPSILGLYPRGGPIVLVTMNLYARPESAFVAAHEFIHLLQAAAGENPNDSCAREREAFELTYALNEKYGLIGEGSPVRVVRWPEAASMYGCPA